MIRKISIVATLLMLISGCSSALPLAQDEKIAKASAESQVGQGVKKAQFYANQAKKQLAQAQQLHSEVEAMLVESREIKNYCANVSKQAAARRKAAQRQAAARKVEAPKPVIDPNYSPSDMPETKQ